LRGVNPQPSRLSYPCSDSLRDVRGGRPAPLCPGGWCVARRARLRTPGHNSGRSVEWCALPMLPRWAGVRAARPTPLPRCSGGAPCCDSWCSLCEHTDVSNALEIRGFSCVLCTIPGRMQGYKRVVSYTCSGGHMDYSCVCAGQSVVLHACHSELGSLYLPFHILPMHRGCGCAPPPVPRAPVVVLRVSGKANVCTCERVFPPPPGDAEPMFAQTYVRAPLRTTPPNPTGRTYPTIPTNPVGMVDEAQIGGYYIYICMLL
jgi:hypothetical protein